MNLLWFYSLDPKARFPAESEDSVLRKDKRGTGFSLNPERPGLKAHPAEWAGAEATGSLSRRGSLISSALGTLYTWGAPAGARSCSGYPVGKSILDVHPTVLILRQQDLSYCLPLCSSSLSLIPGPSQGQWPEVYRGRGMRQVEYRLFLRSLAISPMPFLHPG